MGRSFPNDGNHKYLQMLVASLGTVSDYTIVGLINPDITGRGAVLTLRVSSANKAQIIIDSATWFGGGDFAGFNTAPPVASKWQIIGCSHAAGTNVLRWHYWNYTDGGAKTHGNGGFAVADPGVIDDVRLGDGDNESHGDMAVGAVWKRVLSDGEFDSLCTAALTDWAALTPDALWADDLETDLAGNGHDLDTTVGTVDVGTDPPGFDYSLTPPVVEGAGTAALGALTASGAGVRLKLGAATAALGGLTATGAGVRLKLGSATATLGGLTGTGTGVRSKTAVGVATLGALAGVGAGSRAKAGAGSAALGALHAVGHAGTAVIPGHAILTAARPSAGITAGRPLATVEAS